MEMMETMRNTNRSHFRISCDAMSYISSNISRMAAVPNAGIRMRSVDSHVRCVCDGFETRLTRQLPILFSGLCLRTKY